MEDDFGIIDLLFQYKKKSRNTSFFLGGDGKKTYPGNNQEGGETLFHVSAYQYSSIHAKVPDSL